jgi:serine/threonine protein kinase
VFKIVTTEARDADSIWLAGVAGASPYAAPELIIHQLDTDQIARNAHTKHSLQVEACDTWSCGILFYMMVHAGVHPFLKPKAQVRILRDGTPPLTKPDSCYILTLEAREYVANLKRRTLSNTYLPSLTTNDDKLCHQLRPLLTRMLALKPSERPSMSEAFAELRKLSAEEGRVNFNAAHTRSIVSSNESSDDELVTEMIVIGGRIGRR